MSSWEELRLGAGYVPWALGVLRDSQAGAVGWVNLRGCGLWLLLGFERLSWALKDTFRDVFWRERVLGRK